MRMNRRHPDQFVIAVGAEVAGGVVLVSRSRCGRFGIPRIEERSAKRERDSERDRTDRILRHTATIVAGSPPLSRYP